MKYTTLFYIIITIISSCTTLKEPPSISTFLDYNKTPLSASISSHFTKHSTVHEFVTLLSNDNFPIPLHISYRNDTSLKKIIILNHGITQSYDQWWKDLKEDWSFPSPIREYLVKTGYIVIALDSRKHGRRKGQYDFPSNYTYIKENYTQEYERMVLQTAIDDRRIIDYIETRKDFPLKELSIMGFSMGAHIAWIASSVDPRVKNLFILGIPSNLKLKMTSPLIFKQSLNHFVIVQAQDDHFNNTKVTNQLFNQVIAHNKKQLILEGGHDFSDNLITRLKEYIP